MTITDYVSGRLQVVGLPDGQCFTTWQDFINAIPSLFGVEVPRTVTNVSIGATQPPESEKDNLWVRIDGSGNFLGFYVFTAGAWRKAYQYTQNDVLWQWGRSDVLEDGFRLIDQNSNLPSTVIQSLMLQYVVDPINPGVFNYFAVQFVGYGAI